MRRVLLFPTFAMTRNGGLLPRLRFWECPTE